MIPGEIQVNVCAEDKAPALRSTAAYQRNLRPQTILKSTPLGRPQASAGCLRESSASGLNINHPGSRPGRNGLLPGGGPAELDHRTAQPGATRNSRPLPASKIQSATKKVIINLVESAAKPAKQPKRPESGPTSKRAQLGVVAVKKGP